jgi:2-haloacid dehalogenase
MSSEEQRGRRGRSIDFGVFSCVSFDCYGTLIDWESGILAALAPVLERHRMTATEKRLLRLYARQEAAQEEKRYQSYRSVLRNVMAGIAADVGFAPTDRDLDALPDSVAEWPAFSDTPGALARLAERYRLAVVSNVDDDLFGESRARLGVELSAVVTAEQVGSYKPAHGHFLALVKELGVRPREILHVAQSLYHDHVPAKWLGFTTVWVNRESRLSGTGVSLPAEVRPDLEVPDLATLVELMGL